MAINLWLRPRRLLASRFGFRLVRVGAWVRARLSCLLKHWLVRVVVASLRSFINFASCPG